MSNRLLNSLKILAAWLSIQIGFSFLLPGAYFYWLRVSIFSTAAMLNIGAFLGVLITQMDAWISNDLDRVRMNSLHGFRILSLALVILDAGAFNLSTQSRIMIQNTGEQVVRKISITSDSTGPREELGDLEPFHSLTTWSNLKTSTNSKVIFEAISDTFITSFDQIEDDLPQDPLHDIQSQDDEDFAVQTSLDRILSSRIAIARIKATRQ